MPMHLSELPEERNLLRVSAIPPKPRRTSGLLLLSRGRKNLGPQFQEVC